MPTWVVGTYLRAYLERWNFNVAKSHSPWRSKSFVRIKTQRLGPLSRRTCMPYVISGETLDTTRRVYGRERLRPRKTQRLGPLSRGTCMPYVISGETLDTTRRVHAASGAHEPNDIN